MSFFIRLYSPFVGHWPWKLILFGETNPEMWARVFLWHSPQRHVRHQSIQWILQVMFPSAWRFIVCWLPLSFTTWPSSSVWDSSYIYFQMLKGFCFAAFFYVVTLCMFLICVLFLCCFPSRFFGFFMLILEDGRTTKTYSSLGSIK
jgi:hypothetical protein